MIGTPKPFRHYFLLMSGTALIAGCGGGEESGPTVANANVNAGPDVAIALPDTRTALAGTASGGTIRWSQVSGPSIVAFRDASSPATAVAMDKAGTYVLRLSVTDAAGKTIGSDDVSVTVNPNPVQIGTNSTPLDHLKSFPRPALRTGNTMLPLSLASCAVSSDTRVELMKHWAYGGQVNEGTNYGEDKVFAELRANPGKYPSIYDQSSLYGVFDNYQGQRPDYPTLPPETYIRDAQGNIILRGGRVTVSPIAPDSALVAVGNYIGTNARRLERDTGQKFTLMNNGGEAGFWIPGDNDVKVLWGIDPRVTAAMRAAGFNPDNYDDWHRFASRQKARQERIVKETAYASLQLGRPVAYSWYQESFGGERGRWSGWKGYNFLWDEFIVNGKPVVSDYASPEMYFAHGNKGWTGFLDFNVPWDALTIQLRNIGGMRTLGQSLIYPWVSQGWEGSGISDDDTFIGAMKALYTAGAIGAVSGYFVCEGAPFLAMAKNNPVGTQVPVQIRGMVNLAKVHALFTFLEPFLRNGDLLPGDGNHPYDGFDITTPAMEFNPVGEATPPAEYWIPQTRLNRTARVLARKMRNADRWLVTAWANTGEDRDVKVTIDPKLGQLTLRARKAGSVYIVELEGTQVKQTLVDTDGMNPTRNLFPDQGPL
ncbi:PKD domain-containing protein [Erythrobacter colymbi]|uniref:PKD domain-containing protein n=1 Tax=Erythrobacter colymbi TaxID=1161202 RepID=UPI000A3603D7|nr:hypothetical protein [Erythrobacter colymbi]